MVEGVAVVVCWWRFKAKMMEDGSCFVERDERREKRKRENN